MKTFDMDAFSCVVQLFPGLKENKKREIVRLVYEIAKRDNCSPHAVLGGLESAKFPQLKAALLKKRYPQSYGSVSPDSFYLPRLESGQAAVYNPPSGGDFFRPEDFYPERVYIENGAENSALAKRAAALFPESEVLRIEKTKDFLKHTGFTQNGYHNRHKHLFLFNEKYDYIKSCPCTKDAVCCGYNVLNLGFGCPFDCEYCFLQEYQNFPAFALPCNADDFLDRIEPEKMRGGLFDEIRIGSGEFTDSLVFDHITGWSELITERFRKKKGVTFEFKTKSVNIGSFLKMEPSENIVIAWSVNPQPACEHFAASLPERLAAAGELAGKGWRVAFHFDPIILYDGWENGYRAVTDEIFARVPAERIAWLSLGTLRFRPPLKKVIEQRFPGNTILDAEMVLGFDGKLRYPEPARVRAYRALRGFIADAQKRQNALRGPRVYLCMESAEVWKLVGF
ncbi:MAG: spore photoproduct lyase family protein [Elusimicrobiaceae bacterium]